MKVQMKQWEIERVKETIADILHFWEYDSIKAEDDNGRSVSMSTDTFLKQLERELKQGN